MHVISKLLKVCYVCKWGRHFQRDQLRVYSCLCFQVELFISLCLHRLLCHLHIISKHHPSLLFSSHVSSCQFLPLTHKPDILIKVVVILKFQVDTNTSEISRFPKPILRPQLKRICYWTNMLFKWNINITGVLSLKARGTALPSKVNWMRIWYF